MGVMSCPMKRCKKTAMGINIYMDERERERESDERC